MLRVQAWPRPTKRQFWRSNGSLRRLSCFGSTRDVLATAYSAWAQHTSSSAYRKTNAHLYQSWCIERRYCPQRHGLNGPDVFFFKEKWYRDFNVVLVLLEMFLQPKSQFRRSTRYRVRAEKRFVYIKHFWWVGRCCCQHRHGLDSLDVFF